ncbi:MAG: hypothetical protein V3T39_08315 [Gammaproteobacteria bacterium]
MRTILLVLSAFVSTSLPATERFAPETPVLNVGAEEIRAERLKEFQFTWIQVIEQNDEWVERGSYSESLKKDDMKLRHEQIISLPGDRSINTVTDFDAKTLFVNSVVRNITSGSPDRPSRIEIHYGDDGYSQRVTLGNGEQSESSLHTAVKPFASQAFGLVISALPLETDYRARLPVAFPQLQMWYWIELVVVDEITVQYKGRDVELFVVDAHWMNVSDGSVYPGGKDQSGGQYHIVKDGGGDLPHVWRYMSEHVDIRPAGI